MELNKHVPAETNTLNNERIVGQIVFSVLHVISEGSLWIYLWIPLLLPSNSLINTLLQQ
jgi:hypothetical protein